MSKKVERAQTEADRIAELEAQDPTIAQIFGRGPFHDPTFQERWTDVLREWKQKLDAAIASQHTARRGA